MEGTWVGSAGTLCQMWTLDDCAGCLGGSQPTALGWVARLHFIYRSNKPTSRSHPILKSRKSKSTQAQPGVTGTGQVWQLGVATGPG